MEVKTELEERLAFDSLQAAEDKYVYDSILRVEEVQIT